jgi:hypothetical protein
MNIEPKRATPSRHRLAAARCSIILLFCAWTGWSPPPDEPIEKTFQRFSETFLPQSEQLVADISRTSGTRTDRQEKHFESAAALLSVLRSHVAEVRGHLQHGRKLNERRYEFHLLYRDLVNLRRVVDMLMVELLLTKDLEVDDPLVARVRLFWMHELYYGQRFSAVSHPPPR